jgi:hypothetical protein
VALHAQTITGSVTGTVTDPQKAVIVNAKITITNTETGISNSTVTNGAGVYDLRFLQIGEYKLKIEAAGFRAQSFGPFPLEADQLATINATLNVQSGKEQVEVNAGLTPLLDTENATLGTTLDTTAIANVPLNSRNFQALTLFIPGAVQTNPAGMLGTNAIERSNSQSGQASINANRTQQNNYLLDGIEINETINNYVGYNPSPDSLAEVKVVATNAEAEYGNVAGGDVLAILKSGTSQYHGSAFTYLENYQMDANTWANKDSKTITPKQSYTQDIFGGTVGGPVPHLKRIFFFADYEAARYHKGSVTTASVATSKMRSGDFSELLNPAIMCSSNGGVCASNSSLIQLYDPSNGYAAYSGNLNVPINNPVAKYLFAHPALYPLPNNSPSPNSPVTNNYVGPSKSIVHNNQGDAKIDWKISEKDQGFIRYLQGEAGDTSVNPLELTFAAASTYPTKGLALNYIHTFTPSIVNEARAGYTRVRYISGNPVDTTGVFGNSGNSLLGIGGSSQVLPGFSDQVISALTAFGSKGSGTNFIDNTFEYGDDLTWLHGHHNLKMGAQFLRYQQNNFFPGNDGALGWFNFTGVYTENPAATTITNPNGYGTGGYSVADFVLDRAYYAGIGAVNGRTGQRQWRSGYFFQDDYKLLRNLTVNVGVRYEVNQPIYEIHNREASVNLSTGALEEAGQNGNSRALYDPNYQGIMPRIGVSYSPTDRIVIRSGFGITRFLEGTGAALRLTYNPPWQPSFEATGTAPNGTTAGTSFTEETGFSGTTGSAYYSGTTYNAWQKNLKPAEINEYSLSTEYQINNYSSLSVGYVGQLGQRLIQVIDVNQLYSPCTLSGVLQSNPNTTACAAADPAPYYSLVGQAGLVLETAAEGMMDYNGLQATYRRRNRGGLETSVNYTLSRGMTNTRGFFGVTSVAGPPAYAENAYNNHAEYGPAGFDVHEDINGSAVYELPFGQGKLLGGGVNNAVDEFIGGWKLAGTGVFYSGFPVTIFNNSNNAYTNNTKSSQRGEHLRPLIIKNRNVYHWFGTDPSVVGCGLTDNGVCAYASPANGTYGNAKVGEQRAPSYTQFDLSLFKDFKLYREHKLGLRADATNAFNISSYSNPDNNVQDSNFGQITGVRSVPRQLQLSAKYEF